MFFMNLVGDQYICLTLACKGPSLINHRLACFTIHFFGIFDDSFPTHSPRKQEIRKEPVKCKV